MRSEQGGSRLMRTDIRRSIKNNQKVKTVRFYIISLIIIITYKIQKNQLSAGFRIFNVSYNFYDDGISTLSITWMTPFEAKTSVVIMLLSLIFGDHQFGLILTEDHCAVEKFFAFFSERTSSAV